MLGLLQDHGALAYGIDPDPGAVEFARASGYAHVQQGDLSSLDPSLRFDLTISMDVIEHPLDPGEMLEQCSKRLNLGGILLLWTPNAEHGANDPERTMFRIHLEHLQYFNASSLSLLATKFGLAALHLETHGHPYLGTVHALTGHTDRFALIRKATKAAVERMASKQPGIFKSWLMKQLRGNYSLLGIFRRSG